MSGVHSFYSASASERLVQCGPSAELESKCPDTPSEYAEEGTMLHEHVEAILEGLKFETVADGLTADHAEAVRFVADYIERIRDETPTTQPEFLEYRIESDWIPRFGGTLDFARVGPKLSRIVDFKFGAGVPVSAINNRQGLSYALLLVEDCRRNDIEIGDEFELVILQPRRTYGKVSRWAFGWAELLEHRAALERAIEFPTMRSGAHCQFCRARAVCPELRRQADILAGIKLGKYDETDPALLAELLEIAGNMPGYIKAIGERAKTAAMSGVEIPGRKLVETIGNRAYTLPKKRILEDLRGLGYTDDEITETKVLSPAKLEKLKDPCIDQFLGGVTERPKTGLALVPLTDKRPAVGIKDIFNG